MPDRLGPLLRRRPQRERQRAAGPGELEDAATRSDIGDLAQGHARAEVAAEDHVIGLEERLPLASLAPEPGAARRFAAHVV
jgi:hypothetical protein